MKVKENTNGIVEIRFEVEGVKYKMVNMCEAKSETRKWIHQFQDVTAILFVVALSDYDKIWGNVDNRMQESLYQFSEVCNSRHFLCTPKIIIFTNHKKFKEKIARVNLNVCFRDYAGTGGYKDGVEYISNEFIKQNIISNNIPIIVNADTFESGLTILKAVKECEHRRALLVAGL